MEDQKGGTDSEQRITLSLKENVPGSKEITIMIIGSIGRIRSFTISRRILLWSSICLSLYILISLFIVFWFVDTSSRYRNQAEMIKENEERYNGIEKDLLKAQQYAANLEEYIKTSWGQKETDEEEGQAVDSSNSSDTEKGREQTANYIGIEGLSIRRLESGVVVDFRLVNMNSEDVAIEGYMHLIVGDENNNFPPVWNSPSREIKDGLPSDFRRGERFVIQRFKQYHREFSSDTSSGMPSTISILVYDFSGNLIQKSVHDVNDVS